MNFTPIDNRGLVEGFCLLKSVDKKTSSKGDTYLDITLADREGEINAKLWNYSESLGTYEANTIVKVIKKAAVGAVIGDLAGICAAAFVLRVLGL